MFEELGVRLVLVRKANMAPHAWFLDALDLRAYRHMIETLNSQLESMGVERLRARTNQGFDLKVYASLMALACTNVTVHSCPSRPLCYTQRMTCLLYTSPMRAEHAALQEQVAAALARIAELEQRQGAPPSFVKPNRPTRTAPSRPRKQRAPEHNRARRREGPPRIVTHALDRCPACTYR